MKEILNDYIFFIREFENLLRKKYNLDASRRITSGIDVEFNRKGHIKDYEYMFHGRGCRLERDGIICEYGYYGTKITFTLWDMKQFINTNCKFKDLDIDNLELNLYRLIEEKVLSWEIDAGVVYQIYQYEL
ncbi:DUF6896 domain-containing protein [Chryseobacterium scophthalmum]|uniref:DUF6896 domain-containing protein n=1 Tax=Chryseobacterium scophthalmum TaxID=59733 RepID=UPI00398B63B9